MLVLGVISILTFLLADFTFETKLNKIKIYNQQDKIQARLNAEAGLNFALARMRLYQTGRNKLEKDENLKKAFPSQDLEAVINFPLTLPFPVDPKADVIQKTALNDFNKTSLLRGGITLSVTKVSGFLNPNGLRLKPAATKSQQENDLGATKEEEEDDLTGGSNGGSDGSTDDDKKKPERADIIIEKKLVETLTRLIKDKSDTDEEFHSKFSNVDPAYLVKELKFYVNDSSKFQDSQRPEIENKFNQKNVTPKHAPLASIDELYLLPSWDDAIVDLMKDRMSVHEVSVISINEITIEDLKILFPAINNIQIEEFFKYRDGDEDKKIKGKPFKDAEDFKNVIVSTLNIVSDTDYDERIKELKAAGLAIDTAGKLFKVVVDGTYNNATYRLVAFVDLPIKPKPEKPPGTTGGAGGNDGNDGGTGGSTGATGGTGADSDKGGKQDKPEPIELLLPRVIELRLE